MEGTIERRFLEKRIAINPVVYYSFYEAPGFFFMEENLKLVHPKVLKNRLPEL